MAKDYPNSGAAFKNDRRREDKNDPNLNGNLECTCQSCGAKNSWWLSIWKKEGDKNGNPWLSISLRAKEDRNAQGRSTESNLRDRDGDGRQSQANLQGGGPKTTPKSRSFDDLDEIPF
jgi:hypothetical protein